jgi:MORN variant repeat protein
MKKILMSLLILILIAFTGCDNNEGPFTMEYRNGELVVLSNNKPAKGNVQYYYNINGVSVTAYEAHYNDGFIDGVCKVYNNKNKIVFEGEFNKKDTDTYDVDIKLFNGTIKGTIRTTSEELIYLFEEPVSKGLGDNVNLDRWFDQRAIDATVNTTEYKAMKKNGIFDGTRDHVTWSEVYKDGVLIEKTSTNSYGETEKISYITDLISEFFKYDKNNVLVSYKYIDNQYAKFGNERREAYSPNYYFKWVTPEDKGTISYQDVDTTDIFVYIILDGDIAPAITVSRDGDFKLERWALPRGLKIDQEHLKSLYYEVIGSNLAKYPGELNKITSLPNKVIEPYASDVFSLEHYQDPRHRRIDR